MVDGNNQIPSKGPLSILTEEDWTGVCENLRYGGKLQLRRAYRIPIDVLHFNIMNGRYRTRYDLLKQAHPEEVIDPTQDRWRREILNLLNGTWEDKSGIGTKKDRPYFLQLLEDIRERDQERPGVVLETGGVMSGNRRLAALLTLYKETQNPRYRHFIAFIIPSSGAITNADLWHLEMSSQMSQARLTRDYDSMEKILKIRQGVDFYLELKPEEGEKSAVRAVATDFGQNEEDIRKELTTLNNIEQYLNAIGHAREWWHTEGLTEVFTDIGPLRQAVETNSISFEDRGKLFKTIYEITKNGNARYQLIRDIRAAVGPVNRRRKAHKMPSVLKILIDAAPSTEELRKPKCPDSITRTNELVDRFESEFEANKEQEAPVTKAQRAESNLQKLVEILPKAGTDSKKKELIKSLENSISYAQKAKRIVEEK